MAHSSRTASDCLRLAVLCMTSKMLVHAARHCCANDCCASTCAPPHPIAAALESLNIANNLFDELPPALAAATSLTELSLAGNAQLALTAADADLLLRLPSLRRLSLHQTSTPEHVLRWLRHLCT